MEAKLQLLKVTELKELLQAAELPVSGNKADLIKRLLENPEATKSLQSESSVAEAPKEAEVTQSAAADGASEEAKATSTDPVASSAPAASESATEPAKTSTPSEDDRKESLLAELEKRKARAIRFGQPYEDLEKQISRIRKFGLEGQEGDGVDRLDSELKKGKRPNKKSKENKGSKDKAVATQEAAPEPEVDTEELERRKRRAERFGLVPSDNAEKKARVE